MSRNTGLVDEVRFQQLFEAASRGLLPDNTHEQQLHDDLHRIVEQAASYFQGRYPWLNPSMIEECGLDIELHLRMNFCRRYSPDRGPAFNIARSIAFDEMCKRVSRGRDRWPLLPLIQELIPSTAPGPAETAQTNELIGRVQAAIKELSLQEQDLAAFRLEGTPFRIIAERVGTNEGTLRVQMFRVCEKLKRLLDKTDIT